MALTIPLCTMLSKTTWSTQLQDYMKQKRTNQQHGRFNSNHHANIYSTILSEQQSEIRPIEAQSAIQCSICSIVTGCVHRSFTKLAQKIALICGRNPKAADVMACSLAATSTLVVTSICICLFSIGRQHQTSAFTVLLVQNQAH